MLQPPILGVGTVPKRVLKPAFQLVGLGNTASSLPFFDFEVKGNFWVGNVDFSNFFYWTFQPAYRSLFPHALNYARFEEVMNHLQTMTGKASISVYEFVALFSFIYNETGGTFNSMKELGGEAHYNAHGYHGKSAGRGLIQLTSDSVYRVALKELGYDYDSMSAEELDALFLKPEVYYSAVRVYLKNQYLAGSHWGKVQQGDFYGFGVAISGGASWYGTLFQQRCEALLNELKKYALKNSASILPNKKAIKYGAIALGITTIGVTTYFLLKK